LRAARASRSRAAVGPLALVALLALGGARAPRASAAPAPAVLPAQPPAAASPARSPAAASPAQAPAGPYDRAGVRHDEQCVATAGGASVVVRDVEGGQLRAQAGPVSEPPEARETCAAAPGVRLEGIEAVRAGGMTLYYSWPLEGGRQASGFIASTELASAPRVDAAAAAGNGEPAPAAPGEPVYEVTPEDIASAQRYGGPTTAAWYTYSVYGRPLAGAAFALMTWSWVDVAGGGIARAAVSAGALFHPTAVRAITLASAAGPGRPANGTVTVRYGYVSSGSELLYGWMVTSHTYEGLCYDHMLYAGGGPPLAGTLCPAAALGDALADPPGLLAQAGAAAGSPSPSGTPAAA